MKIIVVGAGYVEISLAVLLSMDNKVLIVDIDESKKFANYYVPVQRKEKYQFYL